MKRPLASIMAIAMILSLTACGGKSSQPSGQTTSPDTPQVTQGNSTPQPSTPQPSEPSVPTTEPQKTTSNGSIPEGAIPLYDGIHYLQFTKLGEDDVSAAYANYIGDYAYTTVGGKKIPRDTIEIAGNINGKESLLNFGGTETFAEQGGLSVAGANFEVVGNNGRTRIEDAYAIKVKFTYGMQENKVTKIDGQTIKTLDDLVALFGEPTFAFVYGGLEYINGSCSYEGGGSAEAIVRYVWQFDDFALVSGMEEYGYYPDKQAICAAPVSSGREYDAYCIKISDCVNLAGVDDGGVLIVDDFDLNIIDMLSDLGLI